MTQQSGGDGADRSHPGPENTPRLRLKRKAPRTGYVDGAWWPHSDDLAAELPDLLAVLSVRLGTVTRVTYNVAEWANPPLKHRIGGHVVRLDGYHRHPLHTAGVLDGRGQQIDLLVVPAQTGDDEELARVKGELNSASTRVAEVSPNHSCAMMTVLTSALRTARHSLC